jgi:hypothetical protein
MLKEAVEDYKRYRQDVEVNNRSVEVLDGGTGKFVERTWADVRVGDVIVVNKVTRALMEGVAGVSGAAAPAACGARAQDSAPCKAQQLPWPPRGDRLRLRARPRAAVPPLKPAPLSPWPPGRVLPGRPAVLVGGE